MAISVVQTQDNSGTGTTVAVTLTATAGGTSLIACIGGLRAGAFATGVSAGGNALTAGPQVTDSGASACGEIWVADNVPSGVTTVTVTWAVANSTTGVVVYEVAGLNSAGSLDKTNTGSANSATTPLAWTSNATGTLAQASEIVVGASGLTGLPTVVTPPSSPWVNTRFPSSGTGLQAGYNIVSATTSQSYAGSTTHSGTLHVATVIASFKAGSGTVPRAQVPRAPAAVFRAAYY